MALIEANAQSHKRRFYVAWMILTNCNLAFLWTCISVSYLLLISSTWLGAILEFFYLKNSNFFPFWVQLPGGTLGSVFSGTFCRSRNVTISDQRGETKLNFFIRGHIFVLNVTFFAVILITFFLLLRLIIRFVGDMTTFRIAMFADNFIIIFSFLNHHHFVNASFTRSGNGANV